MGGWTGSPWKLDCLKNGKTMLPGREWCSSSQDEVECGLVPPLPLPDTPRRTSSYLLLLKVQQLRGAHLTIAVCTCGHVPARATCSCPCGPTTAAISLPREAAHTILTGWSRPDCLRGRFHHHVALVVPGGGRETQGRG